MLLTHLTPEAKEVAPPTERRACESRKSLLRQHHVSFLFADPRVDGFFLMSTPWPSVILTALYVYFVKYGGPQFMENRKPYELRNILFVYNFAMVILSGYIFLEVGYVKVFKTSRLVSCNWSLTHGARPL